MVQQVNFRTDAAAVAGRGIETLSLLTFFTSPGMVIVDLFQTTGVAAANDADWTLYIDGIATSYTWSRVELNPANVGRFQLKSGISIRPGAKVQFVWAQVVAQANTLKCMYEVIG